MKRLVVLLFVLSVVTIMIFTSISCKAGEAEEGAEEVEEVEEVTDEEASAEEEASEEVSGIEGVTLKLVVTSPMVTDELDQEFEDLTGATIEVESISWPDLLPKYTTAFSAESDSFDVFMAGETHTGIFGEAGWYVPLNDMLTDEDLEDIFPSYLGTYTYNGDLVAMPYMGMPYILIYNSKILMDAGLEPAKSWEDVEEQSKQLQDSGVVDYGITWPLLSGDDMSSETWGVVLLSMGGQLFDENGELAFNSEEGLKALEFMVDSIHRDKWASPSSVEVEKMEALKNLMNGDNVYNLNWQFMYPSVIDPEQSSIADFAAMAPVPTSPGAGYSSWFGGAALGINPYISDKQKEAAVEYVKFICGKENALRIMERGWLPMWKSVYDKPEATEINPNVMVLKEQLEKTTLRPVASWYPEFNEILRLELAPAFGGATSPQEALDSAEEKILKRMSENWE